MTTAELEQEKTKRYTAEMFSDVFVRAFLESSDAVQAVISSMCKIVADDEVDPDDRDAALETLIEALFPGNHKGELGAKIEDICGVETNEFTKERDDLETKQGIFADTLEALMEKKGLTQTALANQIGVGQPAISMMLKRKCRPQKRTLEKLSDALEVTVIELWPE